MTKAVLLKSTRVGFSVWFGWIGLTSIGFLASLYWIEVGFKPDISPLQGVIGGIVVGLLQGIGLQQRVPHAWRWGVASAIGWGILGLSGVGVMGWAVPRSDVLSVRLLYGGLHGVQVGLVLGIAQWVVLRSHVSRSVCWILASVCGWAVGLPYGWIVGALLRLKTGLFLAEVVGLTLGWIVVAVITATVLVSLLNQRTT